MNLVLFPSQPFSPRDIDLDFEEERSAVECAVFRNDPAQVAGWFARHLLSRFATIFSQLCSLACHRAPRRDLYL